MKNYTPYFEADGSYNERQHVKPKARPPEFWLDFNRSIAEQLDGQVTPRDGATLDEMAAAMKTLVAHGALPGGRARAVEKQIVMKAQKCMSKYLKSKA